MEQASWHSYRPKIFIKMTLYMNNTEKVTAFHRWHCNGSALARWKLLLLCQEKAKKELSSENLLSAPPFLHICLTVPPLSEAWLFLFGASDSYQPAASRVAVFDFPFLVGTSPVLWLPSYLMSRNVFKFGQVKCSTE